MDDLPELEVNPVFATTHIVGQTVLTVEALHSAAEAVNGDGRKPFMVPDHDHMCPPMGQTVACKVVPIEDGHHALVAEYDFFPSPTEVELPSGETGYQQQSAEHHHPLTLGEFQQPDFYSVGADPTNFGGVQELEDFFTELKRDNPHDFETHPIGRRSAIPDPEVVFTLGAQASAA